MNPAVGVASFCLAATKWLLKKFSTETPLLFTNRREVSTRSMNGIDDQDSNDGELPRALGLGNRREGWHFGDFNGAVAVPL